MTDSLHPLKVWIDVNTTQAAFARKVGCSQPHLSDILNGKKQPSLDLAAKMSDETSGDVPISAFVGRMVPEAVVGAAP